MVNLRLENMHASKLIYSLNRMPCLAKVIHLNNKVFTFCKKIKSKLPLEIFTNYSY